MGREIALVSDDIAIEARMRRELLERGVSERALPPILKDTVTHRSRKGKMGQIVVRKMTGVANTRAARIMKRFEENIGSKEEVVEKLEALGDEALLRNQGTLLALLKDPKNRHKGLARLVAESGAEPLGVMNSYASGCIALGKVEAAIEAHRHLPALVKDLFKHALSDFGVCGACAGTGTLHRKAGENKELIPCSFCEATGVGEPSKLKEFATRQLLEVTKTIEKGGGVTVNTGVKVEVGGGGKAISVFERVMTASDDVLYRREGAKTPTPEVMEAEIVE